jgi:predicted transcriptional regulator
MKYEIDYTAYMKRMKENEESTKKLNFSSMVELRDKVLHANAALTVEVTLHNKGSYMEIANLEKNLNRLFADRTKTIRMLQSTNGIFNEEQTKVLIQTFEYCNDQIKLLLGL